MAKGSSIGSDAAAVPPWRQPAPKPRNKYEKLGMKATNEPGRTPMMYTPHKGQGVDDSEQGNNLVDEIDPELRLAFSRNFQFLRRVFSVDTLLKPLPPQMAQSVASNLGFFTRVFTQFFDPRGIQNVRGSLGLGEEKATRRVS